MSRAGPSDWQGPWVGTQNRQVGPGRSRGPHPLLTLLLTHVTKTLTPAAESGILTQVLPRSIQGVPLSAVVGLTSRVLNTASLTGYSPWQCLRYPHGARRELLT